MDFSDSAVSSIYWGVLGDTECQTAKTAVGTGGGKSGGKPVPVYPQHPYAPAGVETPSPLVTHHRWDCSGCVNIHHCLLFGHVPCCCPAHSAVFYGFWVATSWRTPEWFLCAQGKTISFVQGCCLHKRNTQSVCRYVIQNSAVLWWAQPYARSQEEGGRLGIEEEEED